MRHARWFLHRLVSLVRRRRREADLDAELAFHLDAEADEAAESGLSPDEARRAARRSLGNIALAREDTRGTWTWRRLEELAQDVRYAVRVLRRRPVFTATALLSLALGLGANVAVFNLADNLMFKPLPVERPHELVRLGRPGESSGAETYATYERFRDHMSGPVTVAGTTGLDPRPSQIEIGTERVSAHVQMVTGNYFDVLGVRAYRGRIIREPAPGTPLEPIAVISHDYWQQQYAGTADAIGSSVVAYGVRFTVAGITPPAFRGTDIDFPADVWVPFDLVVEPQSPSRTRGRWIQVIARRHTDVPLVELSAQATSVLGRPMEVREAATGFSRLRGRLEQPVVLVGVLAGLVLLITCANVSNLALSGALARDRELAVRQAIGASRGRIARQLLVESLVLVAASTVLALVVAPTMNAALLSFLPPAQARALLNFGFTFDLRVGALLASLSLVTWLLVGLTPALRTARRHTASAIRLGTGTGGRTRSWTSRGLIVMEVAMCTMLLTTAVVFVRTIDRLHAQDTGYVADTLLVADVDKSPRSSTDDDWVERLHMIRDRLAELPEVRSVGFGHTGQLSGFSINGSVLVPGRDEPASTDSIEHRVSPGFLSTMGTRLLAGRDLAETDDARAPRVAVVNERFAERYFGTSDVVDRQFLRESLSRGVEAVTIVGLVANSKWHTLREDYPIMYYVPYRQRDSASVTFAIRSTGNLRSIAARVPPIVRSIDEGMVTSDVVPFTDIVNRTLVVERLVAHVSTAFAVFGVVIACIGLYGILAFAVVRRTREIGLRIALGARPGSVEWMFLRETAGLLAAGLVVGLPAAYAATRAASSLLFGLEPGDPSTMALVVALLGFTAAAACWIPARRAARIDPMQALRAE